MAEDWAADVKKYVPDADDDIIAGIVRYCGIALQKRDSSLVSFSDPTETGRVRQNFLKKKLALTDGDDVLDAAIAAVGEAMKDDRTKNRVTVYYLLAERFGKLELFRKKASKSSKSGAAVSTPEIAAGESPRKATGGAMGLAGTDLPGSDDASGQDNGDGASAGTAALSAGTAAGQAAPAVVDQPTGGSNHQAGDAPGWLMWLILSLAALFAIWWFLLR